MVCIAARSRGANCPAARGSVRVGVACAGGVFSVSSCQSWEAADPPLSACVRARATLNLSAPRGCVFAVRVRRGGSRPSGTASDACASPRCFRAVALMTCSSSVGAPDPSVATAYDTALPQLSCRCRRCISERALHVARCTCTHSPTPSSSFLPRSHNSIFLPLHFFSIVYRICL